MSRSLLLALLAGCGLFADPAAETEEIATPAGEDAEPAKPLCRPAEAVPKRGGFPWKAGDTHADGWEVTSVDTANLEFIRLGLKKDGTETVLEIAYNDEEPSEWATESYRLMPAPDAAEPPEELLTATMASLTTWERDNNQPFVLKREGVIDPFDGLPPCGADGQPI